MSAAHGESPGGEINDWILKILGRTIKECSAGNLFSTRNKPSGSETVRRVGPTGNPPRRVSQVRATYDCFCPRFKPVKRREPAAVGTGISFKSCTHRPGRRLVLMISYCS